MPVQKEHGAAEDHVLRRLVGDVHEQVSKVIRDAVEGQPQPARNNPVADDGPRSRGPEEQQQRCQGPSFFQERHQEDTSSFLPNTASQTH